MIKEDLQKLSNELKDKIEELIKEYEKRTGILIGNIFVVRDLNNGIRELDITYKFKA